MAASTFLVILIASAIVLLFVSGFLFTYLRYRGKRLIVCPENHEDAAVDIDAVGAATSALKSGTPHLGLASCTRWPEKEGCGQECLAQIEASPDGCAVKTIVASWYAGKHCAVCGREVGPVVWYDRPPALLAADGTSREWSETKIEELRKTFRTNQPLCWPCHLALAFRHEHAELVVERQRLEPPRATLQPSQGVY